MSHPEPAPVDPHAAAAAPDSASRVLKADQAAVEPLYPPTRLLKASVLEVERIREEAAHALQAARRESERLLLEAQAQARRLVEGAEAEAAAIRARVAAEAREQAGKDLTRLIDAFQSACQESYARFPEWVRDSAFKLARHIVEVEFQVRPDLVLTFVDRALQRARHRASVTVHLHPDDLALVEPLKQELMEKHGLERAPQILAADDVARHSVRVETGTHRAAYHLGIDELFEELRQQVDRKIGGGGP